MRSTSPTRSATPSSSARTLGVLALMGWRAGPMWTALCAGFATLALADAIYSVDVLGHSYNAETSFDAVWLAGAMLVAYAAWLPHPGKLEPVRVTGWRAVALPLAAQAFAIIVQLISIFVEVPPSASILTIVVLLIAMVQIVITAAPRRRRRRGPGRVTRPGRGGARCRCRTGGGRAARARSACGRGVSGDSRRRASAHVEPSD